MSEAPAKPKRRKPIRLSEKTKQFFEKTGWVVGFVERFVKPPPPRKPFKLDLFGFADQMAWKVGRPGMVALQTCAMSDKAAHIAKILDNPKARNFLLDGDSRRIGLVCWGRPKKPRGEWRNSFHWITLEMFKRKETPDELSTLEPPDEWF